MKRWILAAFGWDMPNLRLDHVVGAGIDVVAVATALDAWQEGSRVVWEQVAVGQREAKGAGLSAGHSDVLWRNFRSAWEFDLQLWEDVVNLQREKVGAWIATYFPWHLDHADELAEIVALFPCPMERICEWAEDSGMQREWSDMARDMVEVFPWLVIKGR